MDVRKTVTDAGYIAIGLGVMGYQQTQTRRRELTGKLGDVPSKLSEVPAKLSEVPGKLSEVPAKLSEVPGKLSEVPGLFGDVPAKFAALSGKLGDVPTKIPSQLPSKFNAVPSKIEARGREIQGFIAEGSRQLGARGATARDHAEGQVRATVSHVQVRLGDLPERVVQVIEPVAARVRERTGSAA